MFDDALGDADCAAGDDVSFGRQRRAGGAGMAGHSRRSVPKRDLDSAIAINNASYNVSRALGPAIAGLGIAAFSIGLPFWCFCAGISPSVRASVVARPRRTKETLPAERLFSALRTGLRYAGTIVTSMRP